jgi:hypothetical protein
MTKRKSPTIATDLVTRTRSARYPGKRQASVPLPDVLVGMLESISNNDSGRSAKTTRKLKQLPPTAIWCKWLAHGPLKAEIRVRVPVSLPNFFLPKLLETVTVPNWSQLELLRHVPKPKWGLSW